MADPLRNFFKSTLVGTYSDTDTSLTVATGDGALLPDPSVDGAYNLTIFEGLQVTGSTDFEIVRVTARSGDVLTVTRGQESTTPLTIGSATHSILMSATKKTFDDINTAIENVDLTTLTNVESITYDNDGNEVFQLPAGTTAQRPDSPQTAFVRWNTDDERPEVYNGTRWAGINLVGLQDVTLGVATATVTANDAVAQIVTFISQFGTPASAFSVRKLGDVTNAIRVRRSSDNAEQDIGFTSDGDLDESALTTFVGANDGFVTTWYDQSGNSNDATQATAGSQPKIVSSGTVIKENSVPAIEMDGSNHMDTSFKVNGNGDVTFFIVATPTGDDDPANLHSLLGETEDSDDSYGYILFYDTSDADQNFSYGHFQNVISDYDQVDSSQKIRNTQYLITTIRDVDTDHELFIDGVSQGTTATDSTSDSTNNLRIGDDYRGTSDRRFEGTFNEIIFYRADKSADRTDIESDIATYFNITI